ncbi:MAG: glycogen debranching enzyme family protein [Planctomycetia bacterium]|nr:glycogen debranching enzyme family protein [Planctomycetia bacterium]
MALQMDLSAEWLEPNGRGGFASGKVGGRRTRRYHALLLAATESGRFILVNGLEAWIETAGGTFPISTQTYSLDVVHPDGENYLVSFDTQPWPRWTFRLPCGTQIEQQLFVPHQTETVALSWRVLDGQKDGFLVVRPLLSGRDYHGLMRENSAFRFEATMEDEHVSWRPYDDVPAIALQSNGVYQHEPVWYRNFLYTQERERGLDDVEDLASPGLFRWKLDQPAVWMATAECGESPEETSTLSAAERYCELRDAEQKRRASFADPLDRAADAYLIRSGNRRTIIAGYPWFTDWGRDTFIALRGLCLATGRFAAAEEILLAWSECVSDGMLPNRFPDQGGEPEYNSVDASLWYVVAVSDFLHASESNGHQVSAAHAKQLQSAIEAILTGYVSGTRFGIRADDDGLLAAGEPDVQLTWMDAKVGDWVVTPRIGKPVEVQALWLNALQIGGKLSDRWAGVFERGASSFRERFWNNEQGCLYDVVDVNHQHDANDDSLRPNQILAVGGLPLALFAGEQARSIVDVVETQLWTPLGLRTLAPDDPRYVPRCQGGIVERDGAYHQGTVWPWLLGPFVEAWIRVRSETETARREASDRFVAPLMLHLQDAGLGHISEIADGDRPHTREIRGAAAGARVGDSIGSAKRSE